MAEVDPTETVARSKPLAPSEKTCHCRGAIKWSSRVDLRRSASKLVIWKAAVQAMAWAGPEGDGPLLAISAPEGTFAFAGSSGTFRVQAAMRQSVCFDDDAPKGEGGGISERTFPARRSRSSGRAQFCANKILLHFSSYKWSCSQLEPSS
jgi:hypothetical protein